MICIYPLALAINQRCKKSFVIIRVIRGQYKIRQQYRCCPNRSFCHSERSEESRKRLL